MRTLQLVYSRVVDTDPAHAFDRLLPAPLEDVFGRRYALIPPIVGTDQDGTWGSVGQTRVVRQSDGSRMHEELVTVDRPHEFGYRLRVLAGPLKHLVGPIDGTWGFADERGGTRVTWRWSVQPASRLAGPALPALRPLWRGYARQGFDRIERLLADPG